MCYIQAYFVIGHIRAVIDAVPRSVVPVLEHRLRADLVQSTHHYREALSELARAEFKIINVSPIT
jgi:hypothetical protein